MRKTTLANDVDQYLAAVPEPAHTTLEKVRAVIRSCVPREATETISYRIPMFKYKGMLIGFAAFRNHCSVFPASMSVIKKLEKELKNYRTSKGTLQFPSDKSLPPALLKKMVKMRVAENDAKEKKREEKKATKKKSR
jgi:uncharacterized protein YdhG (YjbR/CyaY superfamily)